MSARAVRENDENDNNAGGSGLGLAVAATVVGVGLGIGAALYYFFKPDEERQPPHGATGRCADNARNLHERSSREELNDMNEAIFRQRAWTLEPCSICFEVMLPDTGSGELWTLPCGHRFHLKCVQPWTQQNNTCPNCRKDI